MTISVSIACLAYFANNNTRSSNHVLTLLKACIKGAHGGASKSAFTQLLDVGPAKLALNTHLHIISPLNLSQHASKSVKMIQITKIVSKRGSSRKIAPIPTKFSLHQNCPVWWWWMLETHKIMGRLVNINGWWLHSGRPIVQLPRRPDYSTVGHRKHSAYICCVLRICNMGVGSSLTTFFRKVFSDDCPMKIFPQALIYGCYQVLSVKLGQQHLNAGASLSILPPRWSHGRFYDQVAH